MKLTKVPVSKLRERSGFSLAPLNEYALIRVYRKRRSVVKSEVETDS